MRNRILKYLRDVARPVSAGEVLQTVLGILSPNGAAAERLLKSIVGTDPRVYSSNGLWRAEAIGAEESRDALDTAASLFLQKAQRTASFVARGAVHVPSLRTGCGFLVSPSWAGADRLALERARAWSENRTLIVWTSREIELWNHCLKYGGLPEWSGKSLALRSLAAATLPGHSAAASPEQLAHNLDLPAPDSQDPEAMARYLSGMLQSLLGLVPAGYRASLQDLEAWIERKKPEVDFSGFGFGPELLAQVPELPGVYVMKGRTGDIVYVGKSRNLKHRVRSYFTRRALADAKIRKIHEQLHTFEFFPTSSEVEALLMESRLIRDFRPAINLQTEVHEHPDAYGKALNLLVLVPNAEATRAELYFLHRGIFAGRQSVLLGRAPSKRLRTRINSVYFAQGGRAKRNRRPWEAEIVARWLSSNRRRINFIDIDDAGTFENTIERVADYLRDPEKLSRKVFYR